MDKKIRTKKISKEEEEDEIQEYNNIPNNDEELDRIENIYSKDGTLDMAKDTYTVKTSTV